MSLHIEARDGEIADRSLVIPAPIKVSVFLSWERVWGFRLFLFTSMNSWKVMV